SAVPRRSASWRTARSASPFRSAARRSIHALSRLSASLQARRANVLSSTTPSTGTLAPPTSRPSSRSPPKIPLLPTTGKWEPFSVRPPSPTSLRSPRITGSISLTSPTPSAPPFSRTSRMPPTSPTHIPFASPFCALPVSPPPLARRPPSTAPTAINSARTGPPRDSVRTRRPRQRLASRQYGLASIPPQHPALRFHHVTARRPTRPRLLTRPHKQSRRPYPRPQEGRVQQRHHPAYGRASWPDPSQRPRSIRRKHCLR